MRPKHVYITGASSGIGRALAVEYGRSRAEVWLTARRATELEETARAVRAAGGQAHVETLDVTDVDAVGASLRGSASSLGSLDMVIANAGIGIDGHASTAPWEDIDRVLQVNVRGAFATLVHAIPIFVGQGKGHLVGVSSLAGRRGLPLSGAYSASKAALSAFLDTLRIDLRPSGVRVTDVRPGFIATPLIERHDYKVPFVVPLDAAARHIASRLEIAPAAITFPWQLVVLSEVGRLLPAPLYDALMKRLSEKRAHEAEVRSKKRPVSPPSPETLQTR